MENHSKNNKKLMKNYENHRKNNENHLKNMKKAH